MKGFPSDTSLHAFILEPRIVYDADLAASVTEASDSTDSNDSSDNLDSTSSDSGVTESNDDIASQTDSGDDSTSDDSQASQISSEQDTITGVASSSYNLYDIDSYSFLDSDIADLVLSADGNYVYAVNYTEYISIISIFSIADDGSLSLVQSIHDSDLSSVLTNGVTGSSLITLSDDQSTVYVYSEINQTLISFSRDTDSGELSYGNVTDLTETLGTDSLTDLQESNGYLYLTGGNSVYVLQESSSTLSVIDTEMQESIGGNNTIAVSGDGSTLFVSSSNGGDTAVTIFDVSEDGTLTYLSNVSGAEDSAYYIRSLVVTDDGSKIYAYNSNSTTETYTLLMIAQNEDGVYQLIDSEDVESDVSQLILSSDESTLFTFGSSVTAYGIGQDGSLGDSTGMNTGAADISSGVTSVTHAKDSDQIVAVTTSAVSVFSYQTADVNYTEGTDAVVILPGGLLGDSELDSATDYNGATITISRAEASDNAETGDSYTFIDNNGLTLVDDNLLLDGEEIAIWAESESGVSITFTTSVTQATAQLVLRQIAYVNTSDDPDASGSSATLEVNVKDSDGAESSLEVTLNLTDVNDAPVLTGTDNTVEYTSGDDYVSLFSDASIDTVEDGDAVWKLVLSVDGASDSDELNVNGNIITLESFSGAKTTVNGLSYQVIESDGKFTVTLFISADVSSAADTINNIQYRTTTESSSGDVRFSLSVAEYDGSFSHESITSNVTVIAQSEENQATEIKNETTSIDYQENSGSTAIFPDAEISDAEADARNEGQGNYDGVSVTISLDSEDPDGLITIGSDDTYTFKSQQILKDGVVIANVEKTDNGVVITFTEEYTVIPTTADVNNILDLIQYSNDSDVVPDSSDVSLTVTDSFGNVSNALVVTLALENVNDDPEVSLGDLYEYGVLSSVVSTDDLSEIGNVTSTTISQSGNRVFAADSAGNVAVYSVDSQSGELSFLTLTSTESDTGVTSVLANNDGSRVFVIKSELDTYGSTYSEVTIYTVSDDGVLTQEQVLSLTSMDYSVYQAMSNFTLSDDGRYLFFTSDSGLYSYQVGSDSSDVVTYSSSWSEPYVYQVTGVTVSGDYLFVSTRFYSSTLIAYEISDSGLDWIGYIRNGNTDSDGNTISVSSNISILEATSDGQHLYAVTDSGITMYAFDTETSSFTAAGEIDLTDVVDIALSLDDSVLYVTTNEGHLVRYATNNDNTLTQIDSTTIESDNATVDVISDGDLWVGDSTATYYQLREKTLEIDIGVDGDGSALLMPTITVSDVDIPSGDSYSGFTFTLHMTDESLSEENISLDSEYGFSANEGDITLNGETVATYTMLDGNWELTITGNLTQSQLNHLLQGIRYTAHSSLTNGDSVTFTLTTTDTADAEESETWELNIVETFAPPAVNVDGYSLSVGQDGEYYSVTLPDTLVDDPADLDLTWSVSGLPDGLTFDGEALTLDGTPTVSGEYPLTFTVTNSAGESATLVLSLTIALSDSDATPHVHLDTNNIGVEISEKFEYQFSDDVVSDPQDLALTWEVDGLPDGLSFDAETLILSGTATMPGDYNVTFNVENTLGLSTSFTIVMNVIVETSSPTDGGAANSGVLLTFNDSVQERFVQQQLNSANEDVVSERLESTVSDEDLLASRLSGLLSGNSKSENIETGNGDVSVSGVSAGVTNGVGLLNTSSTQIQTDVWLGELQNDVGESNLDVNSPSDAMISFKLSELTELLGDSVVTVTQSDGQPLPDGVSFNPQTGILTIDATEVSQLNSHILGITVKDSLGQLHQIEINVDEMSENLSERYQAFDQKTSQVSHQSIKVINQLWLAELAS